MNSVERSRRSPSLQNESIQRLLHVNPEGMIHYLAPDSNPGAWIDYISKSSKACLAFASQLSKVKTIHRIVA